MKIIRFFDTPDGGSRFEEIEVRFPESHADEFGNTFGMTRALSPASAVLVELPDRLDQDWHCAPNRQIVVVLSGVVEVETTDGETRRWDAGSLFLADDLLGKGHRTRVFDGPAKLLFLRLADDFRPADWAG